MTKRVLRPVGLAAIALVVIVALWSLLWRGRAASDGPLRATVSTESAGNDYTLEFSPGPLTYDGDTWATHDVGVQIATDEYIQHLSLSDRYVVDGNQLVPAPETPSTNYAMSDQNLEPATFTIALEPLPRGETVIRLEVPVHLESDNDRVGDRDITASVDLIYEVFNATSPLVTFCKEADILLASSLSMDPERFAFIAGASLDDEQAARVERASRAYEDGVATGVSDPNELFDLTEELCGVTYRDRWMAMS